nr:hypothetical protein [Tanacetum cinerariifolium]
MSCISDFAATTGMSSEGIQDKPFVPVGMVVFLSRVVGLRELRIVVKVEGLRCSIMDLHLLVLVLNMQK